MIHYLKKILRIHLSTDILDRVRMARNHFRNLVWTLIGLINPPIAVDDRTDFRLRGEYLFDLARLCGRRDGNEGREDIKRLLMQRVTLDDQAARVLESPYLERICNDPDIHACTMAAAYYARGEIERAESILESNIKSFPTPFNYLSLSRCASHGFGNDRRAVAVIDRGLKESPNDFSLILSAAAAHFRLGDTNLANQYLDSIRKDLYAVVRGSTPTIRDLEAEVATALSQKLSVRPKGEWADNYTEGTADTYWNTLWYHMNSLGRFQHGWPALNHLYLEQISRILTETAPEIRTVINFGVLCANPDYHLALRFPDKAFVGIDREVRTKQLNEMAFGAPNLHFMAANILEALPNLVRNGGPSLLFHARTATVCYPEFLRIFYRTCAAQGVDYLALWENIALSRTTLRFHNFDDMPADSIPYFLTMLIHNYRKLLEEAGYEILEVHRKCSNMDLLEKKEFLGDGHVFLVAKRRIVR